MEDPAGPAEDEVVDERAVAAERLGANPGRAEGQLLGADLRHVALELADERRLPPVAPHLGEPGSEVARREAQEARVGRRPGELQGPDVAPAVALPGEGEDGV